MQIADILNSQERVENGWHFLYRSISCLLSCQSFQETFIGVITMSNFALEHSGQWSSGPILRRRHVDDCEKEKLGGLKRSGSMRPEIRRRAPPNRKRLNCKSKRFGLCAPGILKCNFASDEFYQPHPSIWLCFHALSYTATAVKSARGPCAIKIWFWPCLLAGFSRVSLEKLRH